MFLVVRRRSTNAQGAGRLLLFSCLVWALTLGGCEQSQPREGGGSGQAADAKESQVTADEPAPKPKRERKPKPEPKPKPKPVAPAPAPPPASPPAPPLATPPVSPLGTGAAIEDERNTIAVFEAVAPATVFVTQSQLVRNRFTLHVDEIPAGTGSGFVWDTAGHVVTNFHVVAGGHSFTVTLHDGHVVPAKLVGGDPKRDIAVLALERGALDGRELTPVRLPAADLPLRVGQKALAIGNPFGLDHTLTTGVISALDREVVGFGGVSIRDMIQTDASINPGNSGGPLLDSAGQLIGMNTMIFSKSGSSAGIGFAVPVWTIRRLVPQIIQYGRPRRASLGVEVLVDSIARRAGVAGVIIDQVEPRGPAAKAGLRGLTRSRAQIGLGDVIVGIDEHEVRNYDDLFNALDRYEPGDEVNVKVLRGGEVFAIATTLGID